MYTFLYSSLRGSNILFFYFPTALLTQHFKATPYPMLRICNFLNETSIYFFSLFVSNSHALTPFLKITTLLFPFDVVFTNMNHIGSGFFFVFFSAPNYASIPKQAVHFIHEEKLHPAHSFYNVDRQRHTPIATFTFLKVVLISHLFIS